MRDSVMQFNVRALVHEYPQRDHLDRHLDRKDSSENVVCDCELLIDGCVLVDRVFKSEANAAGADADQDKPFKPPKRARK